MNNKPNVPEETGLVTLNLRKFSFRTDMKVNGWLFVAALTNFASIMLLHSNTPRIFHPQEKDWPVVIRAIIELLPMFISLLWIPHRYWLVLLLVLPLIYMATAIIRRVSEMDEMWRKIVTEALAFSAIATGFTCISYMFLHDMGAPEFRAQWAFCIMWAYYGIGLFFSWRRYK
jgi:ABC-type multidrug transport system fused ATPase/permease subunit